MFGWVSYRPIVMTSDIFRTLKVRSFLVKSVLADLALDAAHPTINVRNPSNMLEILVLAPRNTFELLLSAEIDQFEVEEVDF